MTSAETSGEVLSGGVLPGGVLADGLPAHDRATRLEDGAATLSAGAGRRSIVLHDRFLLAVAGSLVSAGLVAILLGWFGAARSIVVVKQIPYLISGGLLGVALATVGALAFFAHWLLVLIKEVRDQEAERRREHDELLRTLREERAREHRELVDAIRDLALGLPDQPRRPARRPTRTS